jgi:TatA/E family protein of Tat protein translocase
MSAKTETSWPPPIRSYYKATTKKETSDMFLREPSHILILLLVLVVLFGAKRLPDSARSLAKSMRIFKTEMKEIKDDEKKSDGEGTTEK